VLTIRYFAGARAAAGTSEEKADAATLTVLLDELTQAHGGRLAAILPACSFLVDGVAWHDHEVPLPDDATIDVLPPFAGG
jgi:molybdopterin synthase sulfur carrier subunit